MSRNPLTPNERKQILNLRKSGTAVAKIARSLHRGKVTIANFLKTSDDDIQKTANSTKYKVLKPTPKKENNTFIRVDYQKPAPEKTSVKNVTADDDESHTKVSLEHRSVIKFLTKQGQKYREIYSSMKKVYGESTSPSLQSITFWSSQFKNGRVTILSEPKSKDKDDPSSKLKLVKVKIDKKIKENVWAKTKRMSKSKSVTKLSVPPSTCKVNVKRLPMNNVKKAASTSKIPNKISSKRFDTKKKLITIKLPTLKKLEAINNK